MKHLQKEVARLEAELRTPDPSKEKDLKIQQVAHSFSMEVNICTLLVLLCLRTFVSLMFAFLDGDGNGRTKAPKRYCTISGG